MWWCIGYGSFVKAWSLEVMGLISLDSMILYTYNHYWPMRGCHVVASHWLTCAICQPGVGPPIVRLSTQLLPCHHAMCHPLVVPRGTSIFPGLTKL